MINKPSAQEMADFLTQLRRLVLDETISAQQELTNLWAKPIPKRVSLGRTIEGVHIAQIKPNGLIELLCDRNVSRFREGDILCLNRGDPHFQPHLRVTLEIDNGNQLLVSTLDPGLNWSGLYTEEDGWVLDEDYIDLSVHYLDSLSQVGEAAVGRERILPILMGRAELRIDAPRYERGWSLGELHGLNEMQSEAFAQAYAANLFALIQGPPGTGKTRVLAHIAQELVEDGERVLVTALTHRAINNALNKLAEIASETKAIKIGSRTHTDDLRIENYEDFESSPLIDESGGYIIGATPFATRSHRLGGVEFDTVIFDEASQITRPLAVMGMLAAKKYIFIGDHKQLPPVLRTRSFDSAVTESVFGHIAESYPPVKLTETYRLSAELADWSSRKFYDGELTSVDEVARHRIQYPSPPLRLTDVLDPSLPKVFVDLLHRNTTTRSHSEVGLAVDIIETLLECGVQACEIGVITPYRAQAREIRNLLYDVMTDVAIRRQIIVDTIDRMQGQERDLVIYSLTTSNPAFAANIADFLFQPERINVCVTRPRKKLIIIGSSQVLHSSEQDPQMQAAIALLSDLLDTCAKCVLDHYP